MLRVDERNTIFLYIYCLNLWLTSLILSKNPIIKDLALWYKEFFNILNKINTILHIICVYFSTRLDTLS